MSDLEFYSWIAFFVVGTIALPFMFRHRKIILRRIRVAINLEKARAHREDRLAFHKGEKSDPWKETRYL